MTPERFADWLQGFVEIQQSESITDTQWLIIKDHLKLVFDKKTPDRTVEELEMFKRAIIPSTPRPANWEKLSDLIAKDHSKQWKIGDMAPLQITC